MRAFFVIARSSSFTYKGRVVDVPQVGRELGVRSWSKAASAGRGRLRIGVQLVETAAGRLVWSQRFEGPGKHLRLQDQITAQVVAAIEPKLMLAELELTRSKPTGKLQAYELCLRALPQIHHPASKQEAEANFRTAGTGHGHGQWLFVCEGLVLLGPYDGVRRPPDYPSRGAAGAANRARGAWQIIGTTRPLWRTPGIAWPISAAGTNKGFAPLTAPWP